MPLKQRFQRAVAAFCAIYRASPLKREECWRKHKCAYQSSRQLQPCGAARQILPLQCHITVVTLHCIQICPNCYICSWQKHTCKHTRIQRAKNVAVHMCVCVLMLSTCWRLASLCKFILLSLCVDSFATLQHKYFINCRYACIYIAVCSVQKNIMQKQQKKFELVSVAKSFFFLLKHIYEAIN